LTGRDTEEKKEGDEYGLSKRRAVGKEAEEREE
jgi:hypothetical protein